MPQKEGSPPPLHYKKREVKGVKTPNPASNLPKYPKKKGNSTFPYKRSQSEVSPSKIASKRRRLVVQSIMDLNKERFLYKITSKLIISY